jgi:hypothetical protein
MEIVMRKRFSLQLETLRTTIGLLYHSHSRAFIVSAFASLTEPLFYPALLLLLQQLFTRLTSSGESVRLTADILPKKREKPLPYVVLLFNVVITGSYFRLLTREFL